MIFSSIIWDFEPGGNVDHIGEHDLTIDDVEHVLRSADHVEVSESSGRPCVFGFTPYGEFIIVVFDWIDDD
ncbi:MAG: hypothetical protein MI757_08435, partial [Pirellulales bacterium]|nr:hypothetical protein [Pirellulales bacterium]